MFSDDGLGEAMQRACARDQAEDARREVAELRDRVEAFLQQTQLIGAQLREKALEAALRTQHWSNGHDEVLTAARAYEAYLKGE